MMVGILNSLGKICFCWRSTSIMGVGNILSEPRQSERVIERGRKNQFSNKLWIRTSELILRGVHIGNKSVISDSSIATSDIPEKTVPSGGLSVKVSVL
jgi:acetyltransferase-like isoleucine patch superfamily enzyme